MNQQEQNYLNLLKAIIDRGSKREDRTGVGTLSLFGSRLKFSLEDGKIPMLTTKKVFSKGVISELLFFIQGKRQTKELEAQGVNIWKGNTSREFLDKRNLHDYEEGDMGPMYGSLWRDFNGVDQLKNCFDLIKNDPMSRRIMITAYDPSKTPLCVLDPCHLFIQFYVNNGKLSCQYYQRSVDSLLGLPFNLMSYGTLVHIMAKATGLMPGELIFIGGDVHLYNTHIEQAKEQMYRAPYDFPTLKINKEIDSVEDMESLRLEDFEICDYKHHPAIKATMAI